MDSGNNMRLKIPMSLATGSGINLNTEDKTPLDSNLKLSSPADMKTFPI